jgi:murein L,D-transpeptidase YafK
MKTFPATRAGSSDSFRLDPNKVAVLISLATLPRSLVHGFQISRMMPKGMVLVLFCGLAGTGLVLAADAPLRSSDVADKVVVLKSERKLMLMKSDKVLKTYRIALGTDPLGPKTLQGDHKTPEGSYLLDRHNQRSKFHRSIHVSYPNADDRARARRLGVSPGGDIFLHGLPNGYEPSRNQAFEDWTDGCIAVTDPEIDEIFRAVPDGTPIEIKP